MGYVLSGDMTRIIDGPPRCWKEMDVAFELNTSGCDSAAEEAYPSPGFLRILRDAGVPVTLGSDSHSPEQVGRHFDRAYGILREAEYDRVAFFKGRERIMRNIPESAADGDSR